MFLKTPLMMNKGRRAADQQSQRGVCHKCGGLTIIQVVWRVKTQTKKTVKKGRQTEFLHSSQPSIENLKVEITSNQRHGTCGPLSILAMGEEMKLLEHWYYVHEASSCCVIWLAGGIWSALNSRINGGGEREPLHLTQEDFLGLGGGLVGQTAWCLVGSQKGWLSRTSAGGSPGTSWGCICPWTERRASSHLVCTCRDGAGSGGWLPRWCMPGLLWWRSPHIACSVSQYGGEEKSTRETQGNRFSHFLSHFILESERCFLDDDLSQNPSFKLLPNKPKLNNHCQKELAPSKQSTQEKRRTTHSSTYETRKEVRL